MDEEQANELEEPWTTELINRCQEIVASERIDVVIFEDYDKGTLTPTVIETLSALCREKGIKTTVDPKFRNFDRYERVICSSPT